MQLVLLGSGLGAASLTVLFRPLLAILLGEPGLHIGLDPDEGEDGVVFLARAFGGIGGELLCGRTSIAGDQLTGKQPVLVEELVAVEFGLA